MMKCPHCGEMNLRVATICRGCRKNPHESPVPPPTTGPIAVVAAPAGALALVLPGFVRVVVATGERVTLGRETLVDAIDAALDPYDDVSRRHLTIELLGDGPVVKDLSKFGTWLGEQKLETGVATPVVAGQVLRLGKTCYVKVEEA